MQPRVGTWLCCSDCGPMAARVMRGCASTRPRMVTSLCCTGLAPTDAGRTAPTMTALTRAADCNSVSHQAPRRTLPFCWPRARARWPPPGASPPAATSQIGAHAASDVLQRFPRANPRLHSPPLAARRPVLDAIGIPRRQTDRATRRPAEALSTCVREQCGRLPDWAAPATGRMGAGETGACGSWTLGRLSASLTMQPRSPVAVYLLSSWSIY
jgi:hypothetical protein